MALIDEARRRGLIDQIPTGGMRAPAADGSQNNPLNTDLGRNVTNTLNALPGAAKGINSLPGMAEKGSGIAARVIGGSAPVATAVGRAAQGAAPWAPVAGGAAALYSASSPASAPSPAATSSPGAAMPAGVPGAPSAPARTNPFMDAAMAGPPMSASGSITRDGNSYSGAPNISGDVTFRNPDGSVRQAGGSVTSLPAGASPRGLMEAAGSVPGYGSPLLQAAGITPGISSQSMGAADGLAARAQAESMGRLMASGQIAAPAAGPSLIMSGNTGFRRDSRFLAQELGAQRALDRAQGRDPASLRRSAELQREGMQQQGANQRSLWQYALDQQRINQQGEAQGYTNRTNQLVEAARNQVAAEQDPARRRSLVQYMRDIEGRAEPADPYLVVPGGQQIDPTSQRAYNTPASVFNRQTGQFVQQPGAQAPQQGQFEVGQIYRDSQTGAQRRWNGSTWERV